MRRLTLTPWFAIGLILAVALHTSPAFADETAGVRFSVPKGWTSAEKDGLKIVAPSNLKAGEIMVAMIAGAQAATGSAEDQLAGLAATYNADSKVTAVTDTSFTDRGAAGKLYMKSYQVENADLGAHTRMLAILIRGDMRAVVLFVFSSNAVLQTYGSGLQDLMKGLTIVAKPGSLAAPTPPPAAPAANTAAPSGADGHLPTGDTGGYIGSPGWLPSGRGTTIPSPRVVKGRPEGLWWRYQANSSTMFPLVMVFLPDGTHAHNPRFGSGTLVDVEGQRKQPGNTGVGTFAVKSGKISTTMDGFSKTDTFKSGTDKDGPWFEIGAGRHYPLAMVPAKTIVGTWKSTQGKYVFRANGTFDMGSVVNNSEITVAGGTSGTWQADGYLLAIRPSQGASWITSVGQTGKFLVIGQTVYTRE